MFSKNSLTLQQKHLFLAGLLVICVGIVCNEFVLTKALSSDGVLEFETKVMIRLLEFILILIGSVLITYGKLTRSTGIAHRVSQSYPRLLALSIGGCLSMFMLLCAEGVFYGLNRYKQTNTAWEERYEKGRSLHENDSLLGYRPQPNVQLSSRMKVNGKTVYDVIYSTDDYGRRVTPVRNVGQRTRFILFFGCSFTFGEGVNDNETMAFHVAEFASRYKPYNYGVKGYGPQGMLARLEDGEIIREINEKDGILLYTFIDDHFMRAVGSMGVHNAWGHHMPFYRIDSANQLVRRGNFTDGRPIVAFVYRTLGESQIARYFEIEIPTKIEEEHVRLTARVIEESRNTFRKRFSNSRFYVVLFPGAKRAGRMIPYFRDAGIDYVDCSNLIDLRRKEFSIEADPHPNARAYRVVAARVAKEIGIWDADPEKQMALDSWNR